MDIRMRIATMAIAGVGALGLTMMGAGAALAGTGTVTAVTHASDHPDTTNASGPACGISGNGPTWATDNLSRKFSVTDNGNGTFTVVITDHGSFAGFADPNTCQALASNGPIEGTYTLTVTSPTGPDPAGLAPQYRGQVSTSSMVQDLFGDSATSIVGGFYSYSYQNGNYVQDSNGITGSIRGH
jgi:hypothetical protein